MPTSLWIGTPLEARIAFVALATIWGAIFGSFINVIVHRLPRGESPLAGRSRCPQCHAAIRARDNIPIVGWLLRGGACRDCGGRIAAMYPLVEAACGAMCGALAAAGAAGGAVDGLVAAGEWWPLVAVALRAIVLLAILTWALLEAGGWPMCPGGWPLMLAVVLMAAAIPAAGPPGLLPDGEPWPVGTPALTGGVAALAGLVTGTLWGRLAGTATARCGLPLLGATLGWQAVTVVAVTTALVHGLATPRHGRGDRTGAWQSTDLANAILTVAATAAATVVQAVPATQGWH